MAASAPVKTRKSAPGQTVSIGAATSEAEAAVDASCGEARQVVG
jgi:hypothetical protein